jgi:carbon monoxide dehydrogenase subunit G
MDLTHRFSVPAGMDEAWNAFNNLEVLAPCFPGATITSVEGDEFTGSVKIKLGPIALVYSGSGRYVERNDEDRRVVIEARGKDKRGNGTATATVTAKFAGDGQQTDVEVFTDLTITGKPAQFGRGVISDVSDRLLEQFVTCVSDRFSQGLPDTEEATPSAPVPAVGAEARVDESDTEQTIELEAVPAMEEADEVATTGASADVTAPAAEPVSATASAASGSPASTSAPADTGESTLNVLSTVGPVLLRRYGPALAVFALLVFIVIKIIRRKS